MFDDINSINGHPDPPHHVRPYHMHTMFGAPAGDFCHGLRNPDPMGPNWLGPKGFRDTSIRIDGLYLGGAGWRGRPGITFIPGYNAGYQLLDDLG